MRTSRARTLLLAGLLALAAQAAHAQMPGDVIITEILANPAGNLVTSVETQREWFELYNNTSHAINLRGWTVRDSAASGIRPLHVIATDLVIPAFGFVVLGGSTNTTNNGGVPVDYSYGTSLTFSNGPPGSPDAVALARPDGLRIDEASYASTVDGVSRELKNIQSDNANIDGANWASALATTVYGAGGRGTPKAAGQTVTVSPSTFTRMISGTAGTGNDQGWRLLSIPVQGARRADLEDDVTFDGYTGVLYTYGTGSESTCIGGTNYPACYAAFDNYRSADSSGSFFSLGRGFALYLFDTPEVPFTSDLTLDANGVEPYTDVGAQSLHPNQQWHLLGNPFNASFDLSAMDPVGNGFQAGVQIWNARTSNWDVITQDPGTSDVIAPWQGFFVERSTLGAGDTLLFFPYSGRTSGGTFIGKTAQAAAVARFETRLALRNAAGEIVATDAATVEVRAGAREGWDAYDASKLDPLGSRFATLALGGDRNGQPWWHAQRSLPAEGAAAVTIPLRLHTSTGGTATLTLPEAVPGWRVELLDARTGATVDARPSATYSVALDGATKDSTRLALRLTPANATATEPAGTTGVSVSDVWPSPARTSARLVVRTAVAEPVRVTVYDALGRAVVAQAQPSGADGRTEVVVPVTDLPTGLYVVRVSGATWAQSRPLTVLR